MYINSIIGTVSGIINQNVEIPVYINFTASVFTASSISLIIGYDPSKVTCVGFSNIDDSISTAIVGLGTNEAGFSWYDPSNYATFSGTEKLFGLEFQGLIVGSHSLEFATIEYTDQTEEVYGSLFNTAISGTISWKNGWVNFNPIPTTSTTTQIVPTTTLPSSDTYSGGKKQFASTYGSKPMGLRIPTKPKTRSSRFSRR